MYCTGDAYYMHLFNPFYSSEIRFSTPPHHFLVACLWQPPLVSLPLHPRCTMVCAEHRLHSSQPLRSACTPYHFFYTPTLHLSFSFANLCIFFQIKDFTAQHNIATFFASSMHSKGYQRQMTMKW